MARPTKQGIDYFPVDCQFNPKIEMYLLDTEGDGLAVLVSLWQIIYSDEGYFVKYNDDLSLLIKKRINIKVDIINECVLKTIEREIFDKKLFKKYSILTSNGIQKRFFEISKRKKIVNINKDFILKDINLADNVVFSSDTPENPSKKIIYVNFKFKGHDGKPINIVKYKETDWNRLIETTSEKFAILCIQKLNEWYKGKGKNQYGDDNSKVHKWVKKAVKEDMQEDKI